MARWFFRVGGAAGTIAKAMSAYDMVFSDAIYGPYPLRDAKSGALITAGNLRVAPHLRHLCAYLVENRFIESLRDVDTQCLHVYSREVLARIRAGEPGWEEMTPPAVAELIKRRGLLGYRANGSAIQAA